MTLNNILSSPSSWPVKHLPLHHQVLQALRTLYTHMGNITADQVSGLGSLTGPAIKSGGNLPLWAKLGNVYFSVSESVTINTLLCVSDFQT